MERDPAGPQDRHRLRRGKRVLRRPVPDRRKIECVFDPFDMTELTVYWQGRKVGKAVPQAIGRHAHPKAPPDEDDPAPAELTGIDYLQLVADADAAALAGEPRLSALDGPGPEPPDAGRRDDRKPGGEEDQR